MLKVLNKLFAKQFKNSRDENKINYNIEIIELINRIEKNLTK